MATLQRNQRRYGRCRRRGLNFTTLPRLRFSNSPSYYRCPLLPCSPPAAVAAFVDCEDAGADEKRCTFHVLAPEVIRNRRNQAKIVEIQLPIIGSLPSSKNDRIGSLLKIKSPGYVQTQLIPPHTSLKVKAVGLQSNPSPVGQSNLERMPSFSLCATHAFQSIALVPLSLQPNNSHSPIPRG